MSGTPGYVLENLLKRDHRLKELITSGNSSLSNLMSGIPFRTSYYNPSKLIRSNAKYNVPELWGKVSGGSCYQAVCRTSELLITCTNYTTLTHLGFSWRRGWRDDIGGWVGHEGDVWWAISKYKTHLPPKSARTRGVPLSIFYLPSCPEMAPSSHETKESVPPPLMNRSSSLNRCEAVAPDSCVSKWPSMDFYCDTWW